eukprot:4181049-Pyramimonas_sp.AAC.1
MLGTPGPVKGLEVEIHVEHGGEGLRERRQEVPAPGVPGEPSVEAAVAVAGGKGAPHRPRQREEERLLDPLRLRRRSECNMRVKQA